MRFAPVASYPANSFRYIDVAACRPELDRCSEAAYSPTGRPSGSVHQRDEEIGRNEALEVVGVERGRIIARNERGEQKILTAKQSRCFSVYERRAIEVSAGDRLLLMANRRDAGLRATGKS